MSVRESAERLRKHCAVSASENYQESPYYRQGGSVDFVLEHIDRTKTSTAYLADHPADEDEPITDAWLREIGFADGRMSSDLTLSPIVRGRTAAGCEYWIVRSYPLPYVPKTRGQIRKLLDALGVETKGGA